jgi:predicted Fe-Mo cluster-binding NifX family protein
MWIAVPEWQGRVSPVLDVARRLRLFDVREAEVVARLEHRVDGGDPVRELAELGVEMVICGALSRHLLQVLTSLGVVVHAEVCGEVDQVVQAHLEGRLDELRFASPASARRRGSSARLAALLGDDPPQ